MVHGAVCGCGQAPTPPPTVPKFDWEKRVEWIRSRSWNAIRKRWPSEVPVPGNPGSAPPSRVEEMEALKILVKTVEGMGVDFHDPVPGVRKGCIAEAVYLLHKSVNTLGAAQFKAEHGFLTVSLVSAYQSAFFSMKAVLNFLGIVWLQAGRESYIVDVWPPEGLSQNPIPMSVIKVQRIEHRELWTVFLRLIRSTTQTDVIWPRACLHALKNLDAADFAEQRNDLQYRNNLWTIPEDLHTLLTGTPFGVRQQGLADGDAIVNKEDDFSLVLAIVLARMACNMLQDMTEFGGWFLQEWDLIEKWLQQDFHGAYLKAFTK